MSFFLPLSLNEAHPLTEPQLTPVNHLDMVCVCERDLIFIARKITNVLYRISGPILYSGKV